MSVFDLPSASLPLEAWAQSSTAAQALQPITLRAMSIVQKSGATIPFEPLSAQRKFLALVKKIRHEIEIGTRPRGRVRIVWVKSRQIGASTVIQMLGLKLVGTHENAQGLVVAHVSESAQYLHSMSRGMHERLCDDMRPSLAADSRRALVFAAPLRSELVVQVVDEGLGRSRTLHFLHASEVALWGSQGEAALAAVRGALVDEPWCLEILESTGYGMGGVFYDEYYAAKADGRALFSPWYEDPRYRTTPGLTLAQVRALGGPSEAIEYIATTAHHYTEVQARGCDLRKRSHEGDSDRHEMAQVGREARSQDAGQRRVGEESRGTRYSDTLAVRGLDSEQLAWLRYKLVDVYRGDVSAFRREFPSTEEEAFQGDARAVFSDEILRRVDQEIARLNAGVIRATRGIEALWEVPGANLVVRLDEPVGDGSAYVIGADPAEGLEHGDGSDLVVVDRVHGRLVALAHTQLDPDEFAALLLGLAKHYRGAWIACERNNHGHAVLMRLKDSGYNRVWRERPPATVKDGLGPRYGFGTDAPSKAAAIGLVVAKLRDGRLSIPFQAVKDQMQTFVRDEKGKMGASPGCKDDLVSALWIATYAADDLGVTAPLADRLNSAKIVQPVVNGRIAADDFRALERTQFGSAPLDRVKRGRIGANTL